MAFHEVKHSQKCPHCKQISNFIQMRCMNCGHVLKCPKGVDPILWKHRHAHADDARADFDYLAKVKPEYADNIAANFQ
jgi:hypothetical protein